MVHVGLVCLYLERGLIHVTEAKKPFENFPFLHFAVSSKANYMDFKNCYFEMDIEAR